MSIQDRITTAIAFLHQADYDNALIQLSIATDATAAAKYGKKGRSAFKQFIAEKFHFITKSSIGVGFGKMTVGYQHPDLPVNDTGSSTIEDVFYHAMRCPLVHEGRLAEGIKFESAKEIRVDSQTLVLPGSMLYGLLLAIILDESNKNLSSVSQFKITYRGQLDIPLDICWGEEKVFQWLEKWMKEVDKRIREAESSEDQKDNPVPNDTAK